MGTLGTVLTNPYVIVLLGVLISLGLVFISRIGKSVEEAPKPEFKIETEKRVQYGYVSLTESEIKRYNLTVAELNSK